MSETPITPTPTEPPVATATPPVPTPPAVAPDPSDIDGYKNLVAKLRDEVKAAKADRTPQDEKDAKAIAALKRQLESTPSPEDVKKELAQQIGKALGLVQDEPIDPAKLTESLTTAQSDARRAQVELAVFRAATAVNGDPAALLDSTSFLKSLDGVNPSDIAAVQAAISAAVEANPRLGAASEPRSPAPNPAQGASASGVAIPDIDRQIEDATKAGNLQLAISLKQQRSAELLAKRS